MKVALIGGGLTGATLARNIVGNGIELLWFEKSRGLGGQCSTRRTPDGQFDHGAPSFTVDSDAFGAEVQRWVEAGAVAPWNTLRARFFEGRLVAVESEKDRYVGIPGMNALCKVQAGEIPCSFGQRVNQVRFEDNRWHLDFEGDAQGVAADALVMTVPAPQALSLLGPSHPHSRALSEIVPSSVWVAVVRFEQFLNTDFEEILFDRGPLAKAVRNRTKPMRDGPDTWVLYGDPTWSKTYIEATKSDVAQALVDTFRQAMAPTGPIFGEPITHRWRYSQLLEPPKPEPLSSPNERFLVTGSYFFGSTVQGAWRAGMEAARELQDWYKTGTFAS